MKRLSEIMLPDAAMRAALSSDVLDRIARAIGLHWNIDSQAEGRKNTRRLYKALRILFSALRHNFDTQLHCERNDPEYDQVFIRDYCERELIPATFTDEVTGDFKACAVNMAAFCFRYLFDHHTD